MGRRKTNVVTLEVPEEPIKETLPEEQPESEAAETEATGTPEGATEDQADADRQADLDLAAEDTSEAAEAAKEAMEILARIEEATQNVDNAAMQMEETKRVLKFRKEVYENHVEHLKKLCRMRMEKHPLFEGPASDQNDSPKSEGSEGADEKPVDKDGWKKLPLAELGLPAGIVKSLDNAAIFTIGDLCDEMNADPLSWHDDISGIGPAAIEAIAKKFADFWHEHPEWDDDGDDGEIEEDEVDEDEEDDTENDEDSAD